MKRDALEVTAPRAEAPGLQGRAAPRHISKVEGFGDPGAEC